MLGHGPQPVFAVRRPSNYVSIAAAAQTSANDPSAEVSTLAPARGAPPLGAGAGAVAAALEGCAVAGAGAAAEAGEGLAVLAMGTGAAAGDGEGDGDGEAGAAVTAAGLGTAAAPASSAYHAFTAMGFAAVLRRAKCSNGL